MLWIRLYGIDVKRRPKLSENNFVRVSLTKTIFKKGYQQSWSEELFVKAKFFLGDPLYYSIKDLAGEKIRETFTKKL